MNGISHAIRSLHKPNPSPPLDILKIINKGYARITTSETKIKKTTSLNKNMMNLF